MKAILASITPKYCEKILKGEKSLEMRKNFPHCQLPCKVYIYCTKGKQGDLIIARSNEMADLFGYDAIVSVNRGFRKEEDILLNQKVVAEFVCEGYTEYSYESFFAENERRNSEVFQRSCVPRLELMTYAQGKTVYGWNISNLKTYRQPKDLAEFEKYSDDAIRPCETGTDCEHEYYDYSEDCRACAIDFDGTNCPKIKISRAPQSWCYVYEI